MKRLIIIHFILHVTLVCAANKNNYNFINLNTKDGLSSNWINDVYRDSNGLIWIATNVGLNIYDGYQIKIYLHNTKDKHSIPTNQVQKIFEDSKGQIWIGTSGGGVCVYVPEIDGFKKIDISVGCMNPEFSFATIFDILEIDNIFYFATEKSGLIKYQPDSNKFEYFSHSENDPNTISSNYIRSMEYAQGSIWLGGASYYIDKFSLETGKVHRINIPELKKKMGKSGYLDWKCLCYQKHAQTLWIGSMELGLWTYNLESNQFSHYSTKSKNNISHNSVRDIIEYNDQIWAATNKGGINIFNRNGNIFHLRAKRTDKNSLSSDELYSLFKDNEGNLFVGSFDAGINIYTKTLNRIDFLSEISGDKNEIRYFNVSDMAQTSDGTIWMSTLGDGLHTYNPETNEIKRFFYHKNKNHAINANFISALYADNYFNLYISSYQEGFSIYNTQTIGTTFYQNSPVCFNCPGSNKQWAYQRSNDSVLWISSLESGIDVLDLKTGQFFELTKDKKDLYKLNDYKIFDITEVNGNIFFATKNMGLHIYNRQNNSFTIINTSTTPALSHNSLKSIVSDSTGNLWIGTENGVNKLNLNTYEITTYNSTGGYALNHVLDLIIDNKDRVWLSTLGGICKINREQYSIDLWQPIELMFNNTLNVTSCLYDNKGYIYFGGNNGFHRFHPDSVEDIHFEAKIRLTSFQIFNKDSLILENGTLKHINSVNTIHINESIKMFSIGFAVPNILLKNIIKYRYKLENFSSDWILADDDRKATFTGLEGGKYIFMVQSSDIQGNWLDDTRELIIIVHPPFIATWYFKATLFLFILGLVWAIYKVRLKILTKQRNELEKLVKERTIQLENSYQEISAQNEEITAQNEENAKQNDLIVKQNTELQTHRNNLEKLVEERTIELKLAKEKAEESDRLKTSFLHNISHEVRTPLNAIFGFSGLLADDDLDRESKVKYISIIEENTNVLLKTIDDILNISLIESNQLSIDKKTFSLNKYINDIHYEFKISNSNKKVEILKENQLEPLHLSMYTDPNRLTQIITNLLNNALKFTPLGYVKLMVESDEKHLLIKVTDTGIGIPLDKQNEIFERFNKFEYFKNTIRGMGLGLNISKNLAHMLNADLTVASMQGNGSTFTIRFNKDVIVEDGEIANITSNT